MGNFVDYVNERIERKIRGNARHEEALLDDDVIVIDPEFKVVVKNKTKAKVVIL